MDLVKAMRNLGFNQKEAKVYLALLQLGQASAYAVSKRADIKKPTTYFVLEELIDRGVVKKIPRTKTMQFVAIRPEVLFNTVKTRIHTTEEEVLPELKALSRVKDYKVRVSYYEGLDGIREMYNELYELAAGKEYVAFYAHAKDAPPELLQFFWESNEELRRHNIRRRGLTADDKTLQEFFQPRNLKKFDIKLKKLPLSKYNSNISIEILKNHTFIISHRHLQGIVIDNPDIARVLKQIFELVWDREDVGDKLPRRVLKNYA